MEQGLCICGLSVMVSLGMGERSQDKFEELWDSRVECGTAGLNGEGQE